MTTSNAEWIKVLADLARARRATGAAHRESTARLREVVIAALNAGLKPSTVSRATGLHRPTIDDWRKQYGHH